MPGSGIAGEKIAQIVVVLSDKRGTHHDTSLDIGQGLGAIRINSIFGTHLLFVFIALDGCHLADMKQGVGENYTFDQKKTWSGG
jgi:hypothetical protein